MNNKVIIVPSYNCENYIGGTLKSLLNQGADLNLVGMVIITDDCSSDQTIKVARDSWNSTIPLVVFDASKNKGTYLNLNECIARLPSHVDWYLVMYAGNMAKPGWIKTLVDLANKADEHVGTISTSWDDCHVNGVITTGDNKIPSELKRIIGNKESVNGTLLNGCWWHISSCITRVKAFNEAGGLPLGFRLRGDWDFMMRLLGVGWDMVYISKTLTIVRTNPLSTNPSSFRQHNDILETIAVFESNINNTSSFHLLVYFYYKIFITLAKGAASSIVRLKFLSAFFNPFTFVLVCFSFCSSLMNWWLGNRRFKWISSVDPKMACQIKKLSTLMGHFYSLPCSRKEYQIMIDSKDCDQPLSEGEFRKAVLNGDPKTILEVGCGSGRIYSRLVSEGFLGTYTGVEMALEVINRNKFEFPNAIWFCGSGYNLPVKPLSQDCVFAYYVLEHCAFPKLILENLLSVVKIGGKIVLIFPDMIKSGYVGSQALGFDDHTFLWHIKRLHFINAFFRLWDVRFRLPLKLFFMKFNKGKFMVNVNPGCLMDGFIMSPDVDAIYIANGYEVIDWALKNGCKAKLSSNQSGSLKTNALIEIIKIN